uniref:Glutathione synthase n=1 Tax=Cyanothece sp. (strain PCC 7425 / ATCC 29141) TaxID=395961 RepID=B8HK06_CYAP4
MVLDHDRTAIRSNARKTDIFDIFHFRYYIGSNPYLNTAAYGFDFALSGDVTPLPIETYVMAVSDRYLHLREESYPSYAHLFARTVAEVSQLEMGLHLNRWSLKSLGDEQARIAIQSLHARTSHAVIYCVWDWFEAISRNEVFSIDDQMAELQALFRRSVYGGPTVYALLKTADHLQIPTFYLWDEGLMQYGYGQNQIRGSATTFNVDSHLDSDFTTRKDDCKAFLKTLGFPVPKGEIVQRLSEAMAVAEKIGYPVAVKPVVGHKGMGVTADVQNMDALERAYEQAVEAIDPEEPIRVIVEQSITGKDYRLLCVDGRFVAATERRPASVIGDGSATLQELIDRENRTTARSDTPTSAMGKIKCDAALEHYLEEQGLSLDSVLERDRAVYLRKVANLSAGGLSIDATRNIHLDNIILAQDIAQHFGLTCLGIDVIARDLAKSWKTSNLRIIEINAAPGIFMHLKPALGESVDVPAHILKTFFSDGTKARIPIISLNRVTVAELLEMIDFILLRHPNWVIGAACQDGVWINRSQKHEHVDYNTNVRNLLRHPKLNLLIAEYREDVLEREGMFYCGSNLVMLDNPTEVEMMLARDALENSTVVIREKDTITIQRQGLMEQYQLGADEPFSRVYLKEIATIL